MVPLSPERIFSFAFSLLLPAIRLLGAVLWDLMIFGKIVLAACNP